MRLNHKNAIWAILLSLLLTACSKQTTVHLETTEPDASTTQAETMAETENSAYILNTASKKIHFPGCGSVAKIKDENKEGYSGPISDLEAQGYTRCGSCKPK